MNVIQSKLEPEVPVTYGGVDFKETIYVSPRIRLLLENPDALSMSVTIFKHGGTVNGERATPYVRLHRLRQSTGEEDEG